MEWYYILLIVIGAVFVLMLILGTFAVCRAAGLADQRREEEGYAYHAPIYQQLEDVVYNDRYKVSGIAMHVILAVSAKLKLDPKQNPIPLFREELKDYINCFDDATCERYMLMRHVSQNELYEAKADSHDLCYTVAKRELNILLSGILHEEI